MNRLPILAALLVSIIFICGGVSFAVSNSVGTLVLLIVAISVFGFTLTALVLPEWDRRHKRKLELEEADHNVALAMRRANEREHNRRAEDTQLTTPPVIEGDYVSRTLTPEEVRRESWRTFWVEACERCQAWGGRLGWRNAFENALSHSEDWQTSIRDPFVEMEIAYRKTYGSSISADWREGWTPQRAAEHIRMRQSLPLPQDRVTPPAWRRAQADRGNSGETGYTPRKQPSTAGTVYSSENR